MSEFKIPDLREVLKAAKILRRHFPPSPVMRLAPDLYPGTDVYLKLENMLPTRSFKIRGATYLISQLSREERESGVIAASTGNFSQGVSWAAREYGIRAVIVMPEGANEAKVRATRALGGEIIFHGGKFDDARKHAEELAERKGYRYVHSANEPMLVAGVATHTLELLSEQPGIDTVIVPVGGGSGASGACVVAKACGKVSVIGVQSKESPAAFNSWKSGRHEVAGNKSYAEGLATGESYDFTQEIMRDCLDDFILVDDDEIRAAWRNAILGARIVPESASASSIAALERLSDKLKGHSVGLVITGGNSPESELESILGGIR